MNNNNNNNNLDETKVFSPINEKDDNQNPPSIEDTMDFDIPFSKKPKKDLDKTIAVSEEELVDKGLSNIKAAEAELEEILKSQNGSSGGDDMGKKKVKKISSLGKFNIFLLTLQIFYFQNFLFLFLLILEYQFFPKSPEKI